MGDETGNTMNLDLNLGPVGHPHDYPDLSSYPPGSITLEELFARQRRHRHTEPFPTFGELIDGTVGEGVTPRRQCRQRWRSMQRELPTPPETTRSLGLELIGGSGPQTGEASATAEVAKTCDDSNEEMIVFDCNICFDLAREPVVTCCGHLFCWPCLYRWLNLHADAKECPVCKGEVTLKNVTPIYGRGRGVIEGEPAPKIPQRPPARRFESWRQTIQRTAFTIPVEEMLRRLGNRFDIPEIQPEESPERRNSLLARILTSRGMRREQHPTPDSADLAGPTDSEAWDGGRLPSLFRRASNSNPPVDDRDSVSSIAAAIHSESPTVDTTVEIDSTVSLAVSPSGRRNDVDSGDSRPLSRRRLY